MKLPNGYGSVYKLSGSRRKPYVARVTVGWDVDVETGKPIQRRSVIGTFATKKEAIEALAEYGANPYDVEGENMTVAELYAAWSEQYFKKAGSDSSIRTVRSAWSYCGQIADMRVRDVRPRHIRGVVENGRTVKRVGGEEVEVEASPNVKSRIKSLFNMMFDFAVEYELADKNYARAFSIPDEVLAGRASAEKAHVAFTDQEMIMLWDAVGKVRFADWVVVQCYMGWRPLEMARIALSDVDLEGMAITGGVKTAAGRGRRVPIHHRIAELVRGICAEAERLGSKFFLNDPTSPDGLKGMTYDRYAGRFYKVMEAVGLGAVHRPHDPRKTFVTMAKRAGVDEYVIKRLIGHQISDITEAIYTDRDFEWVRSELEKIP